MRPSSTGPILPDSQQHHHQPLSSWASSYLDGLLGLWKSTFLERAHTLFQPDERRDEDQARIAELEQLLGRATRPIEILKKASRPLDAASTGDGI